MIVHFVGIGLTPPPIIKILTPTYNPQMLYNHAIAFKGWYKLEPIIGEMLLMSPMPPDFAELIVKVLVQRTLSKPMEDKNEDTL